MRTRCASVRRHAAASLAPAIQSMLDRVCCTLTHARGVQSRKQRRQDIVTFPTRVGKHLAVPLQAHLCAPFWGKQPTLTPNHVALEPSPVLCPSCNIRPMPGADRLDLLARNADVTIAGHICTGQHSALVIMHTASQSGSRWKATLGR